MLTFQQFLTEGDEIVRGLSITLRGSTVPEPVVARIATGRATANDILSCINRDDVGKWWLPAGGKWSVMPKDFAKLQGDPLASQWKRWSNPRLRRNWFGDHNYTQQFYGSLGILLIAKNPRRKQEMGYAYTKNVKLSLLRIRYNAGNGWKTINASGQSVNVIVKP